MNFKFLLNLFIMSKTVSLNDLNKSIRTTVKFKGACSESVLLFVFVTDSARSQIQTLLQNLH